MLCGGCSKQVRKTSLVYVSDGCGGFRRKRLGACCSSRAVLLLAGTVEGTRCACGKAATTCLGCARDADRKDASSVFGATVKRLKGLLKAYKVGVPDPDVDKEGCDYEFGRIEGIKQVIGMLEEGGT